MTGRSVDAYRAPLFLAWQLTNRCGARCITCCEESGPDRGWRDELTRDEALDLARAVVAFGIPYVAFGGGEPLGVPFCWEIFDLLARSGIALKIETDGAHIDDPAADRMAALGVDCVQISVDGATAATHERVRPGASFGSAISALERLAARGCPPQWVFVPTRLNVHEMMDAYDRAAALGCSAFVTGPMMRIGRATEAWEHIALNDEAWSDAAHALRDHARASGSSMALSIYPWDIVTEMERRLDNPQAMLLVVPNGKVKLLNALPFVAADLRRQSLAEAWDAYRETWASGEVARFVKSCRSRPELLRHANETWSLGQLPVSVESKAP